MTPLPVGIVGRASPPDDRLSKEEHQDGNNHHAPGLALDVRHGVEGYLPALEGRFVSAQLGHQRVRRFVAGGGKEEDHKQDEVEGQSFR